jgi:3'(2'), 5'-bisphosphate nucleotidase
MEQTDLMLAIRAAVKAGESILAIYNDPNSDFQIEKKADNSPLTIADRKAHEVIASMLSTSAYPLLSEEGQHTDYAVRSTWHSLWIVDPLDGTKEFVKRNGEFTVNIALVTDGVPVLGVVYLPVKYELYFGSATLGAYKLSGVTAIGDDATIDQLTARAVRMPQCDRHKGFVVVASRSHLSPETEQFIEQLRRTHGDVEMISSGSSIKICLVAEGKADIYPRFAPTMEWDTAAGDAVARAAGMSVCHEDRTTPLIYNKEDLHNPWFIVENRGAAESVTNNQQCQ